MRLRTPLAYFARLAKALQTRHATHPWNPPCRLELQWLEERAVPSCNPFVDQFGELVAACDNAANTFTLDHSGTTTLTTYTGGSRNFADSTFNTIAINMGTSADVVNIRATAKVVFVNNGGGSDIVNIGKNGTLAEIGARIGVSYRSGETGVAIDDHNRGGPQTATVTSDGQDEFVDGLTQGGIFAQCAPSRDVVVYTGTGAVTANVLSTCGHGLNLHGNSPSTTVNVGNAGSLAGIQAQEMSISSSNGDIGVSIDDHNRGGTRTATFSTVTSSAQFVSVDGLTPGTIYSQCAASHNVAVYTGTGIVNTNVLATCGHGLNLHGNGPGTVFVGNNGSLGGIQSQEITISNRNGDTGVVIDDRNRGGIRTATIDTIVTDTRYVQLSGLTPGTIYAQQANTRDLDVYTGTGAVTVNVRTTVGHGLNLHGNSANTAVFVGNNGSLNGIQSQEITISNRNGDTGVVIDDRNSGGIRTATIDTITSDAQYVRLTGLGALATIYAQQADTRDLDVYTGTGAVTVNVRTTVGHGLNLHGNSPNTTVNVGNAANRLDDLRGPLTVTGQADTTTLNVNDQGRSTEYKVYEIYAGAVKRVLNTDPLTYDAVINYANIGTLTVNGSSGSNVTSVFFVLGTAAGTSTTVNGGAGYNEFVVQPTADPTVLGPVAFHGQPSSNSFLFYNDQYSPTAQTHVLGTNTVSRSGLAPVTYDNLNQVVLYPAIVGGNTTNVPSVAAGVLANLAAADGDTVTLGANQSLAAILGLVVVDPLLDNISASVVIDASADPTPAGPITFSSSPSWDFQISGLAPAVIRFGVLQNTTLNTSLLTGAGDKTFSMQAASQGMALNLDAGSGTNTLDYSNDAGNVLANFQTGEFTGFGSIANIQNVIGGQGANILVGDGNENLTGGPGQNFIISGGGFTQLAGGGAGDILIGGTTAYDTDDASLQAILSYWTTSGDDYPTRVANLRAGNGVPQLEAGVTVFDNGAANTLTGNGNEGQGIFNLFYVTEAGTVTDPQPDEVVVDIDNPAGAPRVGNHDNPGSASRESLSPAAAADLYFLHHRDEMNGANRFEEPAHGGQTSARGNTHPTLRAAEDSLTLTASNLDLFG